jgi:uncharacterized cupin superfamily protein
MAPPNVFEPEWDGEQDEGPFRWRRARLGRQAGGEQLGASLYELAPGAASFPFHAHHANEEMLIVVAGRPTLRTLEEERELAPGEVVAFPRGRRGAHRVDNRSDQPARILLLSTMLQPEIVEYPDSGKVAVRSMPPGSGWEAGEDGIALILRADATAGYFEGER